MSRGSIIGIACVAVSFLLAFALSQMDDGNLGASAPSRFVSLRRIGSSSGGSGRGWGFGGK